MVKPLPRNSITSVIPLTITSLITSTPLLSPNNLSLKVHAWLSYFVSGVLTTQWTKILNANFKKYIPVYLKALEGCTYMYIIHFSRRKLHFLLILSPPLPLHDGLMCIVEPTYADARWAHMHHFLSVCLSLDLEKKFISLRILQLRVWNFTTTLCTLDWCHE